MNNSLTMELLHSSIENEGEYLQHHGIMGMKWGVRRYQNKDGSYTEAGRKRYGIGSEQRSAKQLKKFLNDNDQYIAYNKSLIARTNPSVEKLNKLISKTKNPNKRWKYQQRVQKVLKMQETALSDLKAAEKVQDETLEFAKKHYNITIKDALRDTKSRGERAGTLASALLVGGAIGGIANASVMSLSPGTYTYGSKYKVKDLKEGVAPEFKDKRKYHGDSPTDKKIQENRDEYNTRITNTDLKQKAGDSIVNHLNSKDTKGWRVDKDVDMNDVSISKSGKLKNGKTIEVRATIDQDHYGDTNEKNSAKQIRTAYNNRDKIYSKAIDTLVDDAYEWYGKREGLTKAEIRKGFSDDGGINVYPLTSANNKMLSSGTVTVWCPNIAGGHVGEVEFDVDSKGNVKTHYPSFQG